jgi:hypothetical protein
MENALFGWISKEITYFKKVCKSVHFFAHNSGNQLFGWAIRGRNGPGSGLDIPEYYPHPEFFNRKRTDDLFNWRS